MNTREDRIKWLAQFRPYPQIMPRKNPRCFDKKVYRWGVTRYVDGKKEFLWRDGAVHDSPVTGGELFRTEIDAKTAIDRYYS